MDTRIVKVIFCRMSLVSSGTACFHLTRDREDQSLYMLKDPWRGFGHHSEVVLLRKEQLPGVKRLTEYLAYQSVQCDGFLDDDIRGSITKGPQPSATPMRLVFTNCTTIESAELSTFIEAVNEYPLTPDVV